MKKEDDWQGFFVEFSDSLVYVGKETIYLLGLFLQELAKLLIELIALPKKMVEELLGEAAPDMDFDLDDTTEDDIACRRYGPQKVTLPR